MTIDLRFGDTIEQMKLISDKSIDNMFYPSEELLNAEIVDTMYEDETNTLIIYVIK